MTVIHQRMTYAPETGAAPAPAPGPAPEGPRRDLDWAELQTLLLVRRAGSLSAAARASGLSQPTLSRRLAALEGRKACLLAHHGLIACGKDLAQAFDIAVEVETLAAQFLAACALGEPPLLPDAEIDAVLDKIASGPGYGSA